MTSEPAHRAGRPHIWPRLRVAILAAIVSLMVAAGCTRVSEPTPDSASDMTSVVTASEAPDSSDDASTVPPDSVPASSATESPDQPAGTDVADPSESSNDPVAITIAAIIAAAVILLIAVRWMLRTNSNHDHWPTGGAASTPDVTTDP